MDRAREVGWVRDHLQERAPRWILDEQHFVPGFVARSDQGGLRVTHPDGIAADGLDVSKRLLAVSAVRFASGARRMTAAFRILCLSAEAQQIEHDHGRIVGKFCERFQGDAFGM